MYRTYKLHLKIWKIIKPYGRSDFVQSLACIEKVFGGNEFHASSSIYPAKRLRKSHCPTAFLQGLNDSNYLFCAFQCRPLMVHATPKLFLRPISQRKLHWFQMWIWLPDRSLQETINKISVWLSKWVTYNESNIPILSTPPHHPLFRLSFALGVQWCSSKVSPFLSPGPSACSCLQKP